MMRDLEISLVRSFVAVANSKNMTLAAKRLHRTQGAISQQIKRLEDILQCTLFDRNGRALDLTKEGKFFLDKAISLIQLNDEILGQMVTPQITGNIRLGLPFDLVTDYLPIVMRDIARDFPGVDVELVCEGSSILIEMVKKGDVDLAIVEELADEATGECLITDRLVWIGDDRNRALKQTPLPLSIVAKTCIFHPAVHTALKRAGINWRTVFEHGNIEATFATVRAGLAISASLRTMVPQGVKILGDKDGLPPLPDYSICLHHDKNQRNPVVDELIGNIRREFVNPVARVPA